MQDRFAMCTNLFIQAILTNLNQATHLKSITLSHCNYIDPTHNVFHTLLLFVKRRVSANAKLEEVCVICRENTQWPEFLNIPQWEFIKGGQVIRIGLPITIGNTSDRYRNSVQVPALIQKTYPLYT